eukprot:3257261-Alexandrium_andersonii.AAC.1
MFPAGHRESPLAHARACLGATSASEYVPLGIGVASRLVCLGATPKVSSAGHREPPRHNAGPAASEKAFR